MNKSIEILKLNKRHWKLSHETAQNDIFRRKEFVEIY